MPEKRILLMYISEVSGHHNATLAIEKSLKQLNHHVCVLNINSFNYTNPLLEKFINSYAEEAKSLNLSQKDVLLLYASYYQVEEKSEKDARIVEGFCGEKFRNSTIEV